MKAKSVKFWAVKCGSTLLSELYGQRRQAFNEIDSMAAKTCPKGLNRDTRLRYMRKRGYRPVRVRIVEA